MSAEIGFDLTFIRDLNKMSGEEIVALNIIRGICQSSHKTEYVFFADQNVEKQLRRQHKNMRIVVTSKKDKKFYHKFLKKYIDKNHIKAMFFPHSSGQMMAHKNCKNITVVHGLASKEVSKKELRKAVTFIKNCDGVIAVSQFVKDELLKKDKKIDHEKVCVIVNSVSDIRAGVEIVYKKKYLLCVSNDAANKNLLTLIKAFNEIAGDIEHDLVIVGNISEKGKVYKYINKYGLSHRIIVTGHMDRDTLFGYYKNADLFINTSMYEGFGLTPLEAMASMTKVVTTMVPSIERVDKIECDGYINNPTDHGEIAEVILMAIHSPVDEKLLKKRAETIMSYYSIDKTITKYTEFINRVKEG